MKVEQAARELADKLRAINNDPQFIAVFQLAAVHGLHYSGPRYTQELDVLEAALRDAEKQETERQNK